MKNKALCSLIFLLLFLFLAPAVPYEASSDAKAASQGTILLQDIPLEIGLLDCKGYDETSFHHHISKAEAYSVESLTAGIVPHHLLAGDLIASFYLTVANTVKTIDTVIVLGPNHSGKGSSITVSDCGWNTRYGVAECDEGTVENILSCRSLQVCINNEQVEEDQAASSQVPYIKYYLPEADVVTLLLSRRATSEQVSDLADLLYCLSQEKNILVIGSIDFSHGLSAENAGRKDRETLEAIMNLRRAAIKNMSNEYLDSPETLNVLLQYMESCGKDAPKLLSHSSAADYSGNASLEDCTTYFVFGCTFGDPDHADKLFLVPENSLQCTACKGSGREQNHLKN